MIILTNSYTRRDFLRFFITSLIVLILAFIIKVDLQQGTIPMASFYKTETVCEEQQLQYVAVKIQQDDTIYSIFAATPSPIKTTFPERLSQFYVLNPHLQNQTLIPGNTVLVPITTNTPKSCAN